MVPLVPTVRTGTEEPPTRIAFSACVTSSACVCAQRTSPRRPAKKIISARSPAGLPANAARIAAATSRPRLASENSNAMYRSRRFGLCTEGHRRLRFRFPPWDGLRYAAKEENEGEKRGRRLSYFVDVRGGLEHGVRLLPEVRLRLHAGDHEEHADRAVQGLLDGTAPDDAGHRVDLLAHHLRGLLRLADGEVRPADDADERAAGVGQIDLAEQRGLERLVQGGLHAVPLFLGLADPDHRDAAALHDRHEVRVVEVHEAGLRDDLRHALDRLHEDFVRDLERGVDRQSGHELEELVIVDDNRGVAELAEFVEAGLRVLHPDAAFGLEGHRDDAHREGAFLFRDAGDVLCGAGPGPAAHARRDEHDVRAAEEVSNLFLVLVGGLFADLRERAGTEAFREALADEDLLRRVDGEQVLGVRVHGGQLRARDPGLAASVDRVRSAPAAADDLDRDIDRLDNLFDLFVVAVLLLFHGLGFLGLALFLRLGFLVPAQGFVEK